MLVVVVAFFSVSPFSCQGTNRYVYASHSLFIVMLMKCAHNKCIFVNTRNRFLINDCCATSGIIQLNPRLNLPHCNVTMRKFTEPDIYSGAPNREGNKNYEKPNEQKKADSRSIAIFSRLVAGRSWTYLVCLFLICHSLPYTGLLIRRLLFPCNSSAVSQYGYWEFVENKTTFPSHTHKWRVPFQSNPH